MLKIFNILTPEKTFRYSSLGFIHSLFSPTGLPVQSRFALAVDLAGSAIGKGFLRP